MNLLDFQKLDRNKLRKWMDVASWELPKTKDDFVIYIEYLRNLNWIYKEGIEEVLSKEGSRAVQGELKTLLSFDAFYDGKHLEEIKKLRDKLPEQVERIVGRVEKDFGSKN